MPGRHLPQRIPERVKASAMLRLHRRMRALTDRFPARNRLIWLSEASTRIGTTLDLDQTARELADFTVPRLADCAAVDLLESVLLGQEGERRPGPGAPLTRALAVAAVDGLARRLEPDPVGEISYHPHSVASVHCLVAREPVLIARLEDGDFERVAVTASGAVKMREAGVHSYMAVPLIARGVLLGVADFMRLGTRPPFTDADVALVLQVASRAAVFIDNARLYGREREHVVSLQRSLLPRATPATPGLRVSARYTPTADVSGVGGDWYDVMALPGGRSALVVGDVMGHGLPAAATMGRLRTVARTLMALDTAPERVLARVDMAARDLEDDQVATCLCAVFDPATASYTLASAGHPPPLLVTADGQASYVDVPPGAPLGAGVIPYDSVRLPAPAGSRLVLYTDGLIKSRTEDLDVRLEELRRAVSGMAPAKLDACDLVTSIRGHELPFDEAVLVVATSRRTLPDADVSVWPLADDEVPAATARRLVREQLDRWQLSEHNDVMELVVSELVGNALRYGDGPGELRLMRHDRLTVEVSDTGPDLPQIQHTSLSDEGGRGLQLINMLCRRWGAVRTPAGKIVWAEHDLHTPLG